MQNVIRDLLVAAYKTHFFEKFFGSVRTVIAIEYTHIFLCGTRHKRALKVYWSV